MIPILYEPSERRFLTNGIGRLSDCISCIVTEERNGIYECEFTYPIDGEHYSEIKIGRIIACTHDDVGDIQPFDIYAKSAPLDGIVTFNAHHVSYRLSDIVVMPFEATSCADAITHIAYNSANANPFDFWTDKATAGNYKLEVPKNVRNILGGEEGSLLDVYGKGDYQFDKFNVRLYANRGIDTGVSIRYGKNMTDLTFSEDASDVYNAVVPYWLDSQTGDLVTLPEKVLVFSGATPQIAYLTNEDLLVIRTETGEPIEVAYKMVDAVPLDMSGEFQEKPTVAQLREAATTKFQSSYAWLPSKTVEVDFVQLWQTEEYKDYAPLQRVRLCDTVSVYYPKLGVEAVKEKVIKTVYNVLLGRYDSIELGTPQTTLAQSMSGTIETMIQDRPTVGFMEKAIQYATEMITGNQGGYVVLKENAAGQPEEFLILDNEDINQAVNVWRWNASGLGHSHNGYNGPYDDVAITMDGAINANAITVGNLWANLITAGKIASQNGRVYFDLDNNELACSRVVSTISEITQQGNRVVLELPESLSSTGAGYYSHVDLYDVDYPDNGIRIIPYGSGRTVGTAYEAYNILDLSKSDHALIMLGDPYDAELNFAKYANYDQDSPKFGGSIQLKYGRNASGSEGLCFSNLVLSSWWQSISDRGGTAALGASTSVSLTSADINITGTKSVTLNRLTVSGSKSRVVDTENYSDRLLYCYETPTPLFGDIGEAQLDEEGVCYVDLDDIFSETIASRVEYQVFLQKEGQGDCWVADKQQRYFVIQGTPELKVAWEIKAKQRDYELTRLELSGVYLDEYEYIDGLTDAADSLFEDYINEQEELLYG